VVEVIMFWKVQKCGIGGSSSSGPFSIENDRGIGILGQGELHGVLTTMTEKMHEGIQCETIMFLFQVTCHVM
jgi:hypothetical protein